MLLRMFRLTEKIARLWRENPALLYGLSLYLGTLSPSLLCLPPIALLYCPIFFPTHLSHESPRRRLLLSLPFFVFGMLYSHSISTLPELPQEGLPGTAWVRIDAPSKVTKHYGQFLRYPAIVEHFVSHEGSVARGVTTSVLRSANSEMLSSRHLYRVKARLRPSSYSGAELKVGSQANWEVVASRWGLGDLRYRLKLGVSDYIYRHIGSERAATFLTGLATGEFDDRMMLQQFGRFGLQHLMAISGFHFSLVAAMLAFLFRAFLPPRWVALGLMLAMSSYFLFIGMRPSVMRAWVMILVSLGAYFARREVQPLNTLGLALMVILFYDPLMGGQIGFQFSFLATAAILLYLEPLQQLLSWISPKRPLLTMVKMSSVDQHCYLLMQWFRAALALTLAVHLVTVPYLLAAFHKFPLMSLLYNLFFPFLVAISLFLLLLGVLLPPLHWLNRYFTEALLDFVYQTPTAFDYAVYCRYLSPWLLVGYISIVLTIGLLLPRRARMPLF